MDDERGSRTRIADAALSEFSASGFDGARIARIARNAAVNKQLLYYYYGSKTKLYEAVVQRVSGTLTERIRVRAPTDNPVDRIRARMGALFHHLASHADEARLVVIAVSEDEERSAPIRAAVESFTTLVRQEISAAQGTGYLRDDVDPGQAADQMVALLIGFFSLAPVLDRGGQGPSPDTWVQSVGDLVARSLSW